MNEDTAQVIQDESDKKSNLNQTPLWKDVSTKCWKPLDLNSVLQGHVRGLN